MKRFVIDASVAVKWFVPEAHQDAALRLLDDSCELLAPDLMAAEFGNILWKKIRRGEVTDDEGRDVVRLFNAVSIDLHASRPIIGFAIEIAVLTGRTVYDSLYLALAVLQDCPLVTADGKLYNALKRSPFAVDLFWVEDEL